MDYIPYGRQSINAADVKAVVDVLNSDFLTQGNMVPHFEKSIQEYCGSLYSVAVNSATSALHIACLALGVGEGDIVWTSPITFVASANCALYCKASIDFVDINPISYNMDVDCLEEKLIVAKLESRLPKVVIPVHLSGQPCDMQKIHKLSQEYGFRIIEDASHAIGGKYKNEFIGKCQYSDITVFSFHPVKIITTAEGGMAVTNKPDLAEKMALLRSHGITRNSNRMTHEPDGDWYYQQIELGFNYRMTELQGALGVSQMTRLTEFVKKRHEIAQYYNNLLDDLPLTIPWQDPESYSGMHLYIIRLKTELISISHKEFFNGLRRMGIGANLHYIPVHTQPYFQAMGFKLGDFPEAEKYYQEAISIPMYPSLEESEVEYVVNQVKSLVS